MGIVVRVAQLSMPFYVPILECGHAGRSSTNLSEVAQPGEQTECIVCHARSMVQYNREEREELD